MKFSQFFNEWLYGEQGYYRSFKAIGKGGDFYTAVSTTPLFGGAIARYIYRLIQEGKLSSNVTIYEVGAHQGYLLADIVQFLYTFDKSLLQSVKFAIVEPFESLQKIQKSYFKQSFGDAIALKHYPDFRAIKEEEAFIVANEIFDAFACELIYEGKMAYVRDFMIYWEDADEKILARAKRYNQVKGEVSVGVEEFAKDIWSAFEKFYFVTFDYGDLHVRNDFSLRVYQKHQVFPFFDKELNIKEAFQRSDITYDVNFSHVIDAFEEAGAKKLAFKTQMSALVEFGIMELLQTILDKRGYELYKRELEKVKVLINPSMMGERFKMLSFIKG